MKWIGTIRHLGISALVLSIFLNTSCVDSKSNAGSGAIAYNPFPRKPETFAVSEVNLSDDQSVIGVSVGDQHRAYLMDALNLSAAGTTDKASGQVINDLIGNTPISITFCGESKLCRVLTSSGTNPLTLAVTGSVDHKLELTLNGQERFLQSDPNLPLQDHQFVMTTWSKWKAEHPETDVYIGTLDEE